MARTRIFTQDFSCVRNECRYFTNFILPLRANLFVLKYWRGKNRHYFTSFILTLLANLAGNYRRYQMRTVIKDKKFQFDRNLFLAFDDGLKGILMIEC